MNLTSIKNKTLWLFRRHPLLYYIRFALICKNHKPGSELPAFNLMNQKEDVDELFYEINKQVPLSPEMDQFEKALAIARTQRKLIKGGGGLGFSSNTTLKMMLDKKGGVCSDHSQVFNLFCLINDIQVREWGSVEKFYNPIYGHTFNEIYSEKLKKWIVLDIGKNLYFHGGDAALPFSVIELFNYLRQGNVLKYTHFSDHICIDMYKIDITYSKNTIPFLMINYDNKAYDHYLNKYQQRFPSFVINALMILIGKNYNFLFVMDNYKSKLLSPSKKTS